MTVRFLLSILAVMVFIDSAFAQSAKAKELSSSLNGLFGQSIVEVKNKFGDPEKTEIITNPPNEYVQHSETITLIYRTMLLEYFKSYYESGESKVLLSSVSFKGCSELQGVDCYVGFSADSIITLFGAPNDTYSTPFEYCYFVQYDDMGAAPVKFRLVDGKVQNVTVHFYID